MFKRKQDDIIQVDIKGLKDRLDVLERDNNITGPEVDKKITDLHNKIIARLLDIQQQTSTHIENEIKDLVSGISNEIKNITVEMEDINIKVRDLIKANQYPIHDMLVQHKDTVALDTNTKLIDFQKEIYTKLFTTMESLFKYTKEIQLIDTLAHNIKDNDLTKVRSIILEPILKEKWKMQDIEKTQHIQNNVNKGLLTIIENRNKLEQEKLKLEREGKDSKYITGQLNMLDTIIKESKKDA